MRKFHEDFLTAIARGRSDLFLLVGQIPPFCQPEGLASQHIVIGGLDRAAAHDLTDRRGGLADRFEAVFQASLGSPLLLQLAVATPDVNADQATLPAAVVDRLAPGEVAALLPVALANEPIPASFVLQVGDLSEIRLNQLIQTGILQRGTEGRIELLHVVRTALLARAGPAEERASHLTLSAFYGRSHRPEAVRERFLHLVAAEAWKPAGDILARQERTLLALGYSDQLRSSLRHVTLAIPKGSARIRALRVEATLLRVHSEYSEAILSLRRAIVESESDRRLQSECYCQIVELYVRLRQVDEAERALREARQLGPFSRRLQVFLLLSEARILELKGNLPTAQDQFQAVFDQARRYRVPDLALESIAGWSRLASMGGRREEALRVVAEALPDARQSGRLDIVFNLMLVRARVHSENGQREEAEAEMRAIQTEAEALGYLYQLTYTLSGLAAITSEAGRWKESLAYSRQAITLAERLGNDTVLGHTLALQCSSERAQGMLDESREHGERAVSVLSRLPPSDSLIFARGYLAETYAELGLHAEARATYDAALELCGRMGMDWLREVLQRELGSKLAGGTPPGTAKG
jgi:tetratricopeptide (TPR) repeat protein